MPREYSAQQRDIGGYRCITLLHTNPRMRTEGWEALSSSGEQVALKLIAKELDPEEQNYRRERFRAELEVGQTLSHENVRRLVDFGSDENATAVHPQGVDFLAFEWVDGVSLQALLSSHRANNQQGLEPRAWRDLARAIANGLAALHRATPPWVHRDVKPANILIPSGAVHAARLADMGIAWRVGSPRITRLAGLPDSGTDQYMAPEQFAGSDIFPATDQYALGLVLWECATGEVPYAKPGWHRSDIAGARRAGLPLPNLQVGGLRAVEVQAVLQRALHPVPGRRWPSIASFWQALHAAGIRDSLWDPDVSEPSALVKPTRSTRAAGPGNRKTIWALTGILALLLGTLTYAFWTAPLPPLEPQRVIAV